jgi:hypothetical protein
MSTYQLTIYQYKPIRISVSTVNDAMLVLYYDGVTAVAAEVAVAAAADGGVGVGDGGADFAGALVVVDADDACVNGRSISGSSECSSNLLYQREEKRREHEMCGK